MQNRYAGDCGDLMKCLLLRELGTNLRLGVNWYLVEDELHNGDGRHRNYLRDPRFLQAERDLCERLAAATAAERSVGALEHSGLFPLGTVFYREMLKVAHLPRSDRHARLAHRSAWFAGAMDWLASTDCVFLDPDNGLEVESCALYSDRGVKYAAGLEIEAHLARGQSVILYQHMQRSGTAIAQLRSLLARLARRFELTLPPFAMVARPGTVRYFVVLPACKKAREIGTIWSRLALGPWNWALTFVDLDDVDCWRAMLGSDTRSLLL